MDDTTSYALFAGALVLLVLSGWQARREHVPGKLPLVPWTALQYLALVASILLLAHLVSIWTGHPLVGRRG